MKDRSKKAVYAALFGNLGIALSKLIAAILTGSIALWAETLHSFSDTINQILILIGIKTSSKAASERHPFGHGKEQFFWSFIVATMIFGISGILSVEQGFGTIFGKEHHIENVNLSYIILTISAVFEGNALRVALYLFKQTIESRGEKVSFSTLVKEFQESKDPSILTVIVEDSAALLGIVIAGISISLSETTRNTIFDGIGSLCIGIVLMVFAFFLAKENKALLIGEAISRKDYKRIDDLVHEIPEVNRIISMRTMHFAAEDVLVAIEVSLVDGLNTDEIESVIDHIEQKVKQIIPYISPSKIYVEVQQDSCRINLE
ncbi:MAG TPA: cation diffusion facilitator family transporter [Nitrososphaeraceae archaeon]|nr:cation diffusion facilitator family transporter [Nitrososphaeraceae archaeon]